jgi:hypothetical protein
MDRNDDMLESVVEHGASCPRRRIRFACALAFCCSTADSDPDSASFRKIGPAFLAAVLTREGPSSVTASANIHSTNIQPTSASSVYMVAAFIIASAKCGASSGASPSKIASATNSSGAGNPLFRWAAARSYSPPAIALIRQSFCAALWASFARCPFEICRTRSLITACLRSALP